VSGAPPRIEVLDPLVVNQIAAGEVVERPASVVKELVENSLDAGATRVEVRLEEGGLAVLEVQDDGGGMGAEDLRRAFLPHATSKVRSVDDLQHVASLGFRGEALASIGSVSRASIVSRLAEEPGGHRVEDLEGSIGEVAPAAAAPGTVVRVERLFARVPARRKFLRSATTETGHVSAAMARFALAFPHVRFTLRQGQRLLLDSGPPASRRERIARVHGDEVARDLLEVRAHAEVDLEAYAGPPSLTRNDARLQQVFLNGRFVRDRTVAHAVREAYRDLLPPGGRQPVCFLFLACDPARVDVNVHPAKAEVRWRDAEAVHRTVRRALREALERVRPGVSLGARVEAAFTGGVGRSVGNGAPAFAWRVGERASLAQGPVGPPAPAAADARAVGGTAHAACDHAGHEPTAPLRPLGQALGTYLLLEGEEEVVLVDQHALHERVLFDEINARLRAHGRLEVQHLLVPHVVHLGPAETARLVEETEWLARLGWEVEAFGEDAVAVRGIPAVLRRPDPEKALLEVLALLERGDRDGLDRTALLSDAVDRLACRSAVMANDPLHPDEVMALLARAEALNHSHSCPHGRPTRLVLSRGDLERFFHR